MWSEMNTVVPFNIMLGFEQIYHYYNARVSIDAKYYPGPCVLGRKIVKNPNLTYLGGILF